MIPMADCLFEIGCEELPAKLVTTLGESLASLVGKELTAADLAFAQIHHYATPRRIALLITELACQQPERNIERKGPSKQAAFDEHGQPTKAALGFAQSCGLSVAQLELSSTAKGEWLVYRNQEPGQKTKDLLVDLLKQAIKLLPIARPMRWGAGDIRFARPVHWITLVHGSERIAGNILGLQTVNYSRGHRFHANHEILIEQAKQYPELLEQAYVIADFTKRKQLISQQLTSLASTVGGHIDDDQQLLDEITSIVEWPVALIAPFNADFLQLPKEVLSCSLKSHQKCFPVTDEQGQLLPYFVGVSNIDSNCQQQVIDGNIRVISARLNDAAFFYATDSKHDLISHQEQLQQVVFQEKLGSLGEKTQRLTKLAAYIGQQLGVNSEQITRAALLAKCDLVTDMVGEFPELQGIMGSYYASNDQEPPLVANAIKEHYLPRFANDVLPQTLCGAALAIADRIDTLVGMFGIGQKPSGNKDPLALRRSALGVLRIMIEQKLALNLTDILEYAASLYTIKLRPKTTREVTDFIWERLKAWYAAQGVPVEIFYAVSAKSISSPLDFHQRIQAIKQFSNQPEANDLAIVNKRISNLLQKEHSVAIGEQFLPELVEHTAETKLAQLLQQLATSTPPLCARGEYAPALIELSKLHQVIADFFDNVMVMADDPSIRSNRLWLLSQTQQLFMQIADISYLSKQQQTSSKS